MRADNYYFCTMITWLNDLPDKKSLLEWHRHLSPLIIHEVNAHLHSPYSFSAFHDLEQLFDMARDENVKVLGINDFYTTNGFDSFHQLSLTYRIFPMFNIEFMGLLKEEQDQGIRINDPNNPGRIYFCGKGLDFPTDPEGESSEKILKLARESHYQVKEMVLKVAGILQTVDSDLKLDFEEIQKKFTKGMVRERHIARAIRTLIFQEYDKAENRKNILKSLFGGKEPTANMNNHAELEDEIRAVMLKSGGAAFVKEDPKAFIELDEVIAIILGAGGIPCYPALLDDKNGELTGYEFDWDILHQKLQERHIACIELVPIRNDFQIVKRFVNFFQEKGYIITMGTEHNTPALTPLRVSTRDGVPFDYELRKTAYEGACVIAAHQYLRAKGKEGYIRKDGTAKITEKTEFVELGAAVIDRFLHR